MWRVIVYTTDKETNELTKPSAGRSALKEDGLRNPTDEIKMFDQLFDTEEHALAKLNSIRNVLVNGKVSIHQCPYQIEDKANLYPCWSSASGYKEYTHGKRF